MSAKNLPGFFDYSMPIPFAHRGGDDKHPENTLAAFKHAYKLGYRYFETDVHFTVDGELIAFHDSNLKRTLGLSGEISGMTREHRKTKLINKKYPVPLLAELLETFPDVRFNIDAKSPEAVLPLVKTIKAFGAESRVCLVSFSPKSIKRIRELLPGVPTAVTRYEIARLRYGLPFKLVPPPGARILEIPVHILEKRQKIALVTKRSVADLHAKGCKVYVWTVNEELEMNRLLDVGVDGLFTDKLELLKKVLQSRKQWIDP